MGKWAMLYDKTEAFENAVMHLVTEQCLNVASLTSVPFKLRI